MYPLRFDKVLKEKVWGGRDLESTLQFDLPQNRLFGESWEVSAHPNGPSVVANGPWKGRTLPDLIQSEGPKLLGSAAWDRFPGDFPLLIKYLDIHDKLSIQVHPNDSQAKEAGGGFGKSECWYVIQASPDARLIAGIAPGVDRRLFEQRAKAGQWQGLFREIAVKAGDFLPIKPGTVHASLTGSILICEIQQSSDLTYRIYDFDRLEQGKLRPLHLDQALEVIDFATVPEVQSLAQRTFTAMNGGTEATLVNVHEFKIDLCRLNSTRNEGLSDRFSVLSFLNGSGHASYGSETCKIQTGDTWLLPANTTMQIDGKLEYLRSTV